MGVLYVSLSAAPELLKPIAQYVVVVVPALIPLIQIIDRTWLKERQQRF